MRGLIARERELQRVHAAPLQADYDLFLRHLEARIGLEAKAIGTTHAIDTEKWVVTEKQVGA